MSSCGKTPPPQSKHLVTTSITGTFMAYSPWMVATGLEAVKFVIKRASVQTAGTAPVMNFRPAMQVAVIRPDDPSAWTSIAGVGPYTGAGEANTGVQDISATTDDAAWVRFGVEYYLSGTTPKDGQADVEVQISTRACGQQIGTRTQELTASNTTADCFAPITGWVPAMGVELVAAFFTITNLQNSFRCQLVYRSAATSIQSPSAWTSLEGSAYRNTNGESISGEIPMSLGSEMFVQFGVAYSQGTAGSSPGQATVTSTVAVRRA